MASFCLTACTDDEGKQSSGTNLTPDEHKEKLENIGLEVLGKINPADHEKLLNAIDNFARLADDGLDIERDKAIQSGVNLAKTMANICRRSNPGEMMSFANAKSDVYAAAQFAKIYTYNNGNWEATESADRSLEFRFPVDNQDAVLRITASEEETFVDLHDENGIHYAAYIPHTATATFTLGGETLANVNVETDVNNEARTAVVNSTMNSNSYEFSALVNASKTDASADFSVVVRGETLISGTTHVTGTDMTDGDNISDIVGNDGDNLEDMFNEANAEVNINNRAIIKASCSNINAFVDLLEDLDNRYPSWEEQDSQEYNDKVAAAYNKYNTAELYYTDGDNVIANLSMQSYLYEDTYNPEYNYYDVEPIITFVSDESSFSIESYFDEISFNDLINSAEDLTEAYKDYLQYLVG